MAINRIDRFWGGSPKNARCVAAWAPSREQRFPGAGAKGLQDYGISLKGAEIAREAIKKHEVPPPPKQALNSQEDASYLDKAAAAAGAVVKRDRPGRSRKSLRVPGAPEIIPAQ